MSPTSRTIFWFLLLFGVAWPAYAQEGRISGTVDDASKSMLPGVTVTVKNPRTGFTQATTTNERGEYQVRALPRGSYDVTAEIQGFRPASKANIEVGLDSQVQINFTLEIGTVKESIQVTGEAPIVDTHRSEVGANVSEEQIQTLPVQGRQWINLATLLPGTGQDAIRGKYYNNVNIGAGINFYSNAFYVDGVNNNWQQQGEPRQDFPQDSIAEFRIRAFDYPAQYGMAQGGVLSTITKSGTNEFHGGAFEFYRNRALNTQTIFQTTKPSYQRNQFGGSLGGPIIKNRAQFFVSAERTAEDNFFTVNTNGAFPPEEGTFKAPHTVNMFVGRYDQLINSAHRFFARVARETSLQDYLTAGGTNAASAGQSFAAPRISIVGGETWVLNSSTINDFRIQYGKATFEGWPTVGGPFTTVGDFSPARVASIPTVFIRPDLTTGNQSSFLGPEPRREVKDDFSHVVGHHEIAFGVDLNWISWQNDNLTGGATFTFATDAPFDPNNRATYPILFSQRLGPRNAIVRSTEHSAYVQDTWTASSRVTLNLGLRYDIQTGVWLENLFTDQPQPQIQLGDHIFRSGGLLSQSLFPFWQSGRGDKDNFGPRVGLTWDVEGTGRQVIRAGFGRYYNRYRANAAATELDVRSSQVIIQNPNYPDPYQGQDKYALASASNNVSVQGNRNQNPYTDQFSVGMSRHLGPDLGVSVDATIANGSNQHTTIDANYFATAADRALGIRPLTSFGRVTQASTDGKLRYDAVEFRVDRRLARRWQFLGSYTLSWAKNDIEALPADQLNRAADYGFADADRRHRLVISGTVQPGADVQISGIMRFQSSLPLNILAGKDLLKQGIANEYPPGVTRNQGCRDLDLAVVNGYRAANALAPVSSVNCPSFFSVDLQMSKTFTFSGERRIVGIVQLFNVFNRTNYFPAVNNALSKSFGQSLQVSDGRQGEVAIRFSF